MYNYSLLAIPYGLYIGSRPYDPHGRALGLKRNILRHRKYLWYLKMLRFRPSARPWAKVQTKKTYAVPYASPQSKWQVYIHHT